MPLDIGYLIDKNGKQVLPTIQMKYPHTISEIINRRIYIGWYRLDDSVTSNEDYERASELIGEFTYNDFDNISQQGMTISEHIFLNGREVVLSNGDNDITFSIDSSYSTPPSRRFNGSWIKMEYNGTVYSRGSNNSLRAYYDSSMNSTTRNRAPVTILLRDHTGQIGSFSLKVDPGSTGTIYVNLYKNSSDWLSTEEIPAHIWKTFPHTKDLPEIVEEGIIKMDNRFAPRTQTSGIGIYPLTSGQLNEFFSDLWTETFSEKINKAINGDPVNSILGIKWFYGINSSIPRVNTETYLTLGNVKFSGWLTGSEVTTKPASSELVTHSLGTVTIPRKYGNFLDLAPFTKLQLYVPYSGFIELNASEYAGRELRLDYNINLVTGAASAHVYINTGTNSWRMTHEISCVVGVDIPISLSASDSLSGRIATSIAGPSATLAGSGIGLVGGPVGAIAGGVAGQMTGQAMQNLGTGPSSFSIGGSTSETGSLGDLEPHVVITRPVPKIPSGYNEAVGSPDYSKGRIGSYNGYIKAGNVFPKNVGGDGIPKQAYDEIEELLKTGVYVR